MYDDPLTTKWCKDNMDIEGRNNCNGTKTCLENARRQCDGNPKCFGIMWHSTMPAQKLKICRSRELVTKTNGWRTILKSEGNHIFGALPCCLEKKYSNISYSQVFNFIILFKSTTFHSASTAKVKPTAPSSDYPYKSGSELPTKIKKYPKEKIPSKDSAADTNLHKPTTKNSIDPVYTTASTTYVIPSRKETSPSYIVESSITTSATKEVNSNAHREKTPENAPTETAPGNREEKANVWQKPDERETNSDSHGVTEDTSSQTPTTPPEKTVSATNDILEKPNIDSKQDEKEATVFPYGSNEASSNQPTQKYLEKNASTPKYIASTDSIPDSTSEGTPQTPPKLPEENTRDDPSTVEMTGPPITGKYLQNSL